VKPKFLRALLPSYYHHMMKHDNSLLTRFLGLHRVKPHKGRQVRFLVMGNLFKTPLKIHQRFDLKGSTVGRELSAIQRLNKNPTFKDMDFRRLNKKIPLGSKYKDLVLQQLSEDCKFLVAQHIMDYSLLIGIHFRGTEDQESVSSEDEGDQIMRSPLNKSTGTLPPLVPPHETPAPAQAISTFEREEGGIQGKADDGSELDEFYYLGVIDILTQYNVRKHLEHAYKRVTNRGEISAVEPREYADRFLKFISQVVT